MRPVDQGQYLERLLSQLDSQDREIVVTMVETRAVRLAPRGLVYRRSSWPALPTRRSVRKSSPHSSATAS